MMGIPPLSVLTDEQKDDVLGKRKARPAPETPPESNELAVAFGMLLAWLLIAGVTVLIFGPFWWLPFLMLVGSYLLEAHK